MRVCIPILESFIMLCRFFVYFFTSRNVVHKLITHDYLQTASLLVSALKLTSQATRWHG
ncbi:hypothetical protein BJ165DRAFT_1492907 [Panaeolus papilionaceus]|nr:hypothetical protein BJ165DRAFT_1492907 [Panaeolus papilionaceus]